MNTTKYITSFQWICILLSSSLFGVLMYSQYTASSTGMLVFCVTQLAAGLSLVFLTIPMRKYFDKTDEGIIKYVQTQKPNISFLYSVVYSLYFMYIAAVKMTVGALLLSNFVDTSLPFVQFVAITAICGYFSAVRGIKGISSGGVLLFILSGVGVVFVLVSLAFRADFMNFSYIKSMNAEHFAESYLLSLSGGMILPSVLVFRHNTQDKAKKGILIWIIISSVVCAAMSATVYAVVGEYADYSAFPFYMAAQLMESGSFKRLDVIFLLLWIIGIYINVSMSFASLREIVYMSAEAAKAKYLCIAGVVLSACAALIGLYYENVRRLIVSSSLMSAMYIIAAVILPLSVVVSFKYLKRRRRSAARALTMIAAFSVCAAFLSGCSSVELQDRLIIKGVGIDKTDNGYSVTIQYIDTTAQDDVQKNKCFVVSGGSVGEAMGNIKNSIGFEPFLGQNSAVVIGYDTASESMESIADYFMRQSGSRPSVKLYLSKTTAYDILSFEKDGSIMPIDTLTSLSPTATRKNNVYTLLSYTNQRIDPTQTPVVSVLECKDTVSLATMAVFGQNGLYALDEDGFIAYKTLTGIDEGTVLSIGDLTCKITKCSTKVNASNDGGSARFYVTGSLSLTASQNPTQLSDDEISRIYEQYMENIIQKAADNILRVNNDDIYGFGRNIIDFNRRSISADSDYRELLSNCKLNINIKCKIVDTLR